MRILFILTYLYVSFASTAQDELYTIKTVPISTSSKSEFSPIWHKEGLVFCSNIRSKNRFSFSKRKRYTLYYADLSNNNQYPSIEIFANELTSKLNDGPITFNANFTKAYFNRNHKVNSIFKSFPDSINPLGIFSAQWINGRWRNIEPFPYNNPHYSLLTPALTPDGNRLYFASDMPEGYGGTDIYFCDRDSTGWLPPINAGPIINTAGNESYPFITGEGKLFFSSDGHPGLGGKDIFYSQIFNGNWVKPIHLSKGINSPYDDFGFITNDSISEGYFSSNRNKSDDIFHFVANLLTFDECVIQKEKEFCFIFNDESSPNYDSISVRYEWTFDNKITKDGFSVCHCFPSLGKYNVRLLIKDNLINDSILAQTTYEFEVKNKEQIFISGPSEYPVHKKATFNTLNTHLPNFPIAEYYWNFGDGFINQGSIAHKTYEKAGKYTVELGVLGQSDSLGYRQKKCVSKLILIHEDFQHLPAKNVGNLEKAEQ